MSSKLEAKDKSCIVIFLAKNYPNSQLVNQLKTCKTEEKQKWRHASADAAVKKLTEIAKYFPELTLLLDSLENYSLCEKHYNNIVAKSSFIKQLTETDNSIFLDLNKNNRKKLKISTNDDEFQVFNLDPFEKTSVDFGVQVSLLDPAYEILLKKTKELEYLNTQLLSKHEVLKRRLDEQFKSIEELEYSNQQLLSENKLLKRRLDERFTDQQDRIKSIIEIAKKERSNLFEDISNLIKNPERFSLSSLLEYSPSKWLAERNPVIVKFIETLTNNENKHQNEGEKIFKRAVASMLYMDHGT
jgi:uncharacterized protein YoxC